jgi:hypothetical protein
MAGDGDMSLGLSKRPADSNHTAAYLRKSGQAETQKISLH